MEEFKDLKKIWSKQKIDHQYSKEEIYQLNKKSSLSLMKWILIISILDFVLWGILSFSNLFVQSEDILKGLSGWMNFMNYLNIILNPIFIYLFYKSYKNTSVCQSVKVLITQILQIRKIVIYYILMNLILFSISFFEAIYLLSEQKPIDFTNPIIVLKLGLLFVVFIGVILLLYRLVYGALLNKLHRNYKEISQIEIK